MIPFISITVPTYVLCSTIGAIFVVIYLYLRTDKYNISYIQLLTYLGVGVVSLFIGSKIVFTIGIIPTIIDKMSLHKLVECFINGGIVFYGGMLGVLFGIYVVSKIKKDNSHYIYNYFAPAIPLFHVFGRIGCFLGGCCYGIEARWGFSLASDVATIRFPVQLVESLCNMIIFVVLIFAERKKGLEANLLLIYLFLYSICRFVLEFFRGDIERGIWGALSTSQIISIIIMSICLIYTRKVIKDNEKLL